jgi:hypothetical protein
MRSFAAVWLRPRKRVAVRAWLFVFAFGFERARDLRPVRAGGGLWLRLLAVATIGLVVCGRAQRGSAAKVELGDGHSLADQLLDVAQVFALV